MSGGSVGPATSTIVVVGATVVVGPSDPISVVVVGTMVVVVVGATVVVVVVEVVVVALVADTVAVAVACVVVLDAVINFCFCSPSPVRRKTRPESTVVDAVAVTVTEPGVRTLTKKVSPLCTLLTSIGLGTPAEITPSPAIAPWQCRPSR